jgi:hypothetical protein
MSKLLTYLETTERSQVPVRFRTHASASLRRADRLLRENAQYNYVYGGVASVSGHFGPSNTGPLENNTVRALRDAFRQIFPADLLTLEQAEPRPAKQLTSEAPHPRIDIDYTISWSGTAYTLSRSGRQFAGIQFDFKVTMRMPELGKVFFRGESKAYQTISRAAP